MMSTRLLLFFCLTGHVFAKKTPTVDCVVVHLKYVHCSWNKQGTPEVNYTFSGWFHGDKPTRECPSYLKENNINIGCNQPYEDQNKRFYNFYTNLTHGNQSNLTTLDLKNKVKLYPPTNITVRYGLDSNLWLNWTQIYPHCVQSEVRYRISNRAWATYPVSAGMQNYCINLPSSSSLYELQVRSKMDYICGDSEFENNWSEPMFWRSNNGTDTRQMNTSMSVWTPVLYVVGALVLILLVMMLLHHERVRIIFIPVVPKPSPKLHNIEDWFQFPKGLKESFNYNERPCTVREYCHVSQSDNVSSDSSDCSTCSTCSVTTDQTDCSVFILVNESDLSTPCTSSTSTVSAEEEKPVSV
ncbi:cytokine receptor common subunit gamma-like [Cottoperca gobio]|uniref:Cytokine receptor common subunit gamma-like n=1 Tax=Cottoperca gobio TaxID=56716 RepID=A0A6J2QYE7_COTGO|nr:cytokine receptor common subunit gamma-like [Cottoperca gobio]